VTRDTPPAPPPTPADDIRRMAPTFAAVIIVETITLLGLWWFQTTFR
jgi:hypothetical protein